MHLRINLGLAKKSNSKMLLDSAQYTTSMSGNSLFAAPDIVEQIANTITATTNLNNAINQPLSLTKTDNVRMCRNILERTLTALGAKVEGIANSADVPDDQRAGIVHAAGMEVKRTPTRAKRIFAVVHGREPGSVRLTAQAGPAAHEWQFTKDTVMFTNRISARITPRSSTTIKGLDSYVKYAFFHRAVVGENKTSEWEGPLMIVVH